MAIGSGRKRNKRMYWIVGACLIVLLGAGILIAAKSGGSKIDPSKIAKVDQSDLAKSVVATGKIEPITKVEIKSNRSKK